jgi:hypothetical protein
VDWLDGLETALGAVLVIAVVAASIFRYGNRAGLWFSQLMSEDRRLFWAAIGLVCWTAIVGVAAWSVSFLVYVVRVAGQPTSPEGWAAAGSISLVTASITTALLAGIPWLLFVSAVRLLRWMAWRARDDAQPGNGW